MEPTDLMEPQFCRVCLNKAATVSLFSKKDDNIQYCTKLMRCANVEVSGDDVLPSHICDSCISELNVTYNFIEKCEASEKALRCIDISKEFVENEVKSEIKEETGCHDGIDNDYLLDPASNSNDDVEIKQKCNKRKYRKKNTEKKAKEKVKRGKSGHIQCTICGLMVISVSAMQVHIRTHTGEKPFACSFCDHCYMSKGALKRHTETFHTKRERKFTCETCGSSFYRKNDIITHMRRHTGERPYSCPYCPKSFLQIASLIRHKRIHTGDKPFACGICDKRFTDRTLAKKHLLVHTDEKKFTCQLCNKAMKSKCSLRTHIAAVHSNEKHNVCSFCGMSFSMKGNLKTHIGRMHSEKSGECNICLKTFSDLDVHMRKHTGEKPFVCDTCNKAFGTKRSLANHMVFKHENTGKYKCSIGDCAKTFPVGTMLEFHLLKHHTNHTPYICQHCSRGFYRTSDLSRHLRVSHMDFSLKEPLKSISTSA